MTIADELRAARTELSLSLTEMGARLGADRQTVWRWEQGRQTIRHPQMLRALLAWMKEEKTMEGPRITEYCDFHRAWVPARTYAGMLYPRAEISSDGPPDEDDPKFMRACLTCARENQDEYFALDGGVQHLIEQDA